MSVDEYEYGRIVIDGREERNDVILTDDTLHANWWRAEGHALQLDDLEPVLETRPELLVVGTGTSGNMRPAPGLEEALSERGIAMEAYRSPDAVERYNQLRGQADVALAIHLTC
ncbi:MAG TPA: MTH938/NDUFAF3 family protein [Nitriliruptorales bacterium]|nr:MTH938/NDUFAF3 family protein [Nitriliruptorales bacterium]